MHLQILRMIPTRLSSSSTRVKVGSHPDIKKYQLIASPEELNELGISALEEDSWISTLPPNDDLSDEFVSQNEDALRDPFTDSNVPQPLQYKLFPNFATEPALLPKPLSKRPQTIRLVRQDESKHTLRRASREADLKVDSRRRRKSGLDAPNT